MRAISWQREAFPLLTAVAMLCWLTLLGVRGFANYNSTAPFSDFHAFYCGARAVLEHADPYKQQPLETCEAPLLKMYFPSGSHGVAVPAPVPGYGFALFVPFALLPFTAASWLFFAINVFAIAATIATLRALVHFSWFTLAVLTLAIVAPAALALGQVTPLVVFGLTRCALALREGRPRLAVAATTLVWLMPQIAVPLVLALFAAERRARVAVAVQIALLVIATVVLIGVPATMEYVTKVVPAQADAEIVYAQQIALGPMLAQIGVASAIAMNTGLAVWLCACAGAAVFARRVAARHGDPAFIALVSAPFGLIGGTYLHPSALSVAFPLALVLASYTGPPAAYASAALLLLLPWTPSGVTFFLWPVLMLAALLVASEIGKQRPLIAIALAVVAGVILYEINVEFATLVARAGIPKAIVAHVPPGGLAAQSWAAVVRSDWALALSRGVWFSRAAGLAGVAIVCVLGWMEALGQQQAD